LLFYSEGSETHAHKVEGILREVQIFQIPGFDGLCDRGSQLNQLQPYVESREDDQVLVLHTSGSTGRPRPIYHTNGSINTVGALRELPATDGRQSIVDVFLQPDESLLAVAPFFHMMGQFTLWRSLLCRAPLVILSPEKTPSSELIVKAIEQVRPTSAIFPPSVLEAIVDVSGGLDAIGLLKTVSFSGGPLATGVGERLASYTQLLPMMGSTEAGLWPTRIPLDTRDWQYIEWAPGSGAKMEADSDGLYEMVIVPTNIVYQPVFHAFPDIREWRTNDLFERHPEKKDLWLYKGRKEDLLVLSNGEKFNPVGFEKLVESHPMVKGALVVGQARFQTGLLLEPEWSRIDTTQNPSVLLHLVWPLIEKANATAPAHGKVWRSKVNIAKREKPFRRAPKGSIMRRQTVELYAAEIDALYSNRFNEEDIGRLPSDAGVSTIKKFLHQTLKLKGVEVPDCCSEDDDIFNYGADSLQILDFTSALNHAVGRETGSPISLRDVYSHPTINSLAEFIHLHYGHASS
jgi:aryl carrier-like protein